MTRLTAGHEPHLAGPEIRYLAGVGEGIWMQGPSEEVEAALSTTLAGNAGSRIYSDEIRRETGMREVYVLLTQEPKP